MQEEEFENADKAAQIRVLMQSGGGTQRCVTLAMDIAIREQILDLDIWRSILQNIVKFNMIEVADRLRRDISKFQSLWVNPAMVPIWNLILQAPFKRSNYTNQRICLIWTLSNYRNDLF